MLRVNELILRNYRAVYIRSIEDYVSFNSKGKTFKKVISNIHIPFEFEYDRIKVNHIISEENGIKTHSFIPLDENVPFEPFLYLYSEDFKRRIFYLQDIHFRLNKEFIEVFFEILSTTTK